MGDAAELGRRFVERLTSGGIVENCHLKEFKFIFLSFVHYLHLIKEKFPNQQIEEMLKINMESNDVQKFMDFDVDKNKDEVVIMNDDVLMNMFAENDKNDLNKTKDANVDFEKIDSGKGEILNGDENKNKNDRNKHRKQQRLK